MLIGKPVACFFNHWDNWINIIANSEEKYIVLVFAWFVTYKTAKNYTYCCIYGSEPICIERARHNWSADAITVFAHLQIKKNTFSNNKEIINNK